MQDSQINIRPAVLLALWFAVAGLLFLPVRFYLQRSHESHALTAERSYEQARQAYATQKLQRERCADIGTMFAGADAVTKALLTKAADANACPFFPAAENGIDYDALARQAGATSSVPATK